MRKRFDQQLHLGVLPISEAKIPLKSRDELPPILRALQYIFTTPELNEKIFALLEKKICAEKKNTGRHGMDLWHILVLAVVRHGLSTNWDRLEMIANGDRFVRMIMGVHSTGFNTVDVEFSYQTILDNVHLLDEKFLQEINQVVVEAGHELLKKNGQEKIELKLKTDSYALETNVHFPTDLNLLWDSSRKCLDTVKALQKETHLTGWRKIKFIEKTIKSNFRKASQLVFSGKGTSEEQKEAIVKKYLDSVTTVVARCKEVVAQTSLDTPSVFFLLVDLKKYIEYSEKFSDQIVRRVLKGEVINPKEKIYSIFEPHTEWITKGKKNKPVELGHLMLITTDQHQFINDYHVLLREKDATQVKSLLERLGKKMNHAEIASHSFDKGFWSKDNLEALQAADIKQVVLPKRGKHSKADEEREGSKNFKALRNAHSGVESNINMLEHHGLNRCMDKGLHGYQRCVGLSVLSYNLHHMGNILLSAKRKEAQKVARKVAWRQAA